MHISRWRSRFPFQRPVQDGWRSGVLWSLPVAVCAYLLGFGLERPSGQYSLFDHVTYLVMAAAFVALYILLLSRRWSTTPTVTALLIVVYTQFIGKLVYLLYFNAHPAATQAEFTETFFWIPALFVFSAFVPGLERGRWLVGLFFGLFSAISVAYIVPNWRAGQNFGIIYALLEMLLANLTILILTHHLLGFKENLTASSARAETLARLAYHDTLTGLPNRLALEDELARLIRERSPGNKIAVAFIDIDGFKLINDTYGHASGDALLIEVSRRLNRARRKGDVVFRMGGDEFVVIFAKLPGDAAVPNVGERVHSSVGQPFTLDGRVLKVSVSVGVACCPDDGATAEALLSRADAAMYTVKHGGKDGVAHYNAANHESTARAVRCS